MSRTSGEWGGNPELYAASQCLGVNIYVHQVHTPTYIISSEKATKDIHISYHGECHYNSVRLANDPDCGEPPMHIDISDYIAAKLSNPVRDINAHASIDTNPVEVTQFSFKN